MEAPEYLDLDEIDFSDDISVSMRLLSVLLCLVKCIGFVVLVLGQLLPVISSNVWKK